MPSPVGHVLAGIAVGSLASRDRGWGLPIVCGVMAALSDIDFLLPIAHRGPTHSISAGVAAFVLTLAGLSLRKRSQPQTPDPTLQESSRSSNSVVRIAVAVGCAVLSHVLLDWLGKDSSTPRGLMALWPWTSAYYISDLGVFNAVDRRYWLDGFWHRNAITVAREIAILLPIAWLVRSRQR